MSRLWFACLLLFRDRCRDGRWVFLGVCTQVHGQGSPPSGRGRGGGDAGSLLPGVLPPELDACLCGLIDRDMPATHVSKPPPPPGASPLHTVAGGHCSRSSGRPHGEVPPPEDFGPVPSSSSSSRRRKRKKRRKRRLPRGVRIRRCGHGRALFLRGSVSVCSLAYCRSGRAGRRQWQWYVLGWFFWCSSRCVPFYCRLARVVQTVQKVVQFLDQLFSPVVVQRQVSDLVRTVQRRPWRFHRCCSWMMLWSLRQVPWSSAAVPQLQFVDGRRHLFLRSCCSLWS